MKWYLETELRHGMTEWDISRESFLLNFIFEDLFSCIDEVLQEIKATIFKMPKDPIEWVQPDWNTQCSMCWNATT